MDAKSLYYRSYLMKTIENFHSNPPCLFTNILQKLRGKTPLNEDYHVYVYLDQVNT